MRTIPLISLLLCAACSQDPLAMLRQEETPAAAASDDETRPQARPEGSTLSAPAGARTAEEFDTSSAADRAAAAAKPQTAERSLGTTVASLGDPSRPGFWLETPLVSAPAKGRVHLPGTGKSAQVELIPIEGPATGGSRLSLAAMRLIEAPLTGLPTIEVFTGG